jgi:hypothetical protein
MLVPSDVARERYAICKGCVEFNNILKTCRKCGCFMPAKSKIIFAACPEGKWLKFEGESNTAGDYNIED